eukprot:ANDGO_04675.mRNA.1 hypothetical protein
MAGLDGWAVHHAHQPSPNETIAALQKSRLALQAAHRAEKQSLIDEISSITRFFVAATSASGVQSIDCTQLALSGIASKHPPISKLASAISQFITTLQTIPAAVPVSVPATDTVPATDNVPNGIGKKSAVETLRDMTLISLDQATWNLSSSAQPGAPNAPSAPSAQGDVCAALEAENTRLKTQVAAARLAFSQSCSSCQSMLRSAIARPLDSHPSPSPSPLPLPSLPLALTVEKSRGSSVGVQCQPTTVVHAGAGDAWATVYSCGVQVPPPSSSSSVPQSRPQNVPESVEVGVGAETETLWFDKSTQVSLVSKPLMVSAETQTQTQTQTQTRTQTETLTTADQEAVPGGAGTADKKAEDDALADMASAQAAQLAKLKADYIEKKKRQRSRTVVGHKSQPVALMRPAQPARPKEQSDEEEEAGDGESDEQPEMVQSTSPKSPGRDLLTEEEGEFLVLVDEFAQIQRDFFTFFVPRLGGT